MCGCIGDAPMLCGLLVVCVCILLIVVSSSHFGLWLCRCDEAVLIFAAVVCAESAKRERSAQAEAMGDGVTNTC